MTFKLLDQPAFQQAARRGQARGAGVAHEAIVLRTIDAESRVVRFVFSDGSVDRVGDTIDPNGWDLSAYKRNPVVLFAHDSSAPPIGRTQHVWSDGTRLLGDIKFAPPETYEFADTIFRLIRDGFLRSGSVGFIPIDYEFSKDADRPFGIDFKRQELAEFSIVPVPANANALIEARAKGLLSSSDLMRLRSYRRRDTGDVRYTGNCGRPADAECGLKVVAECSIHGQQGAGIGDGDGEKMMRMRRVRELQRRLAQPVGLGAAGDDDQMPNTKAERIARAAQIRARTGIRKRNGLIEGAEFRFRLGRP